jgi:hypothetical protein
VTWSPEPRVSVGGVDVTGQAVGLVTVSRGRRTVYERPNAGYASIELRDVGDLGALRVGSDVQVSVADSGNGRVTVFTGSLSDWEAQTVATGGEPVVFYRLQAVGPLARVNRRQVLVGGAPEELDGDRVRRAVELGLAQQWEEVPFSVTWASVGTAVTWETWDGEYDSALIDDGVFTLAALGSADGGYNALSVAQDAGFSGEGILFETAGGRVGYADADRRFANEQAGALEVPAGLLDVQGLRVLSQLADISNVVTVEFDGGAVTEQDTASIVEFGRYETDIRTQLANQSNAEVRAEEFLLRHAIPAVNLEELPVNLLSVGDGLRDGLLAAGPNDFVEVTGIPARVGFTSFRGFVEGLTFSVGEFEARLSLLVSDRRLSVGSQRWGQVADTIAWQDVDATLVWQDAREVTV